VDERRRKRDVDADQADRHVDADDRNGREAAKTETLTQGRAGRVVVRGGVRILPQCSVNHR
jgi:hypothetical protein